jgi:hypothetical protein
MPKTKKQKEERRQLVTGSSLLAGAAGAAATPSVVNAQKAKKFVNIDPNSKNLAIFSEGGKYNTGGSGHAAAAQAIADAHLKKHPGSKVKILNYGDYSGLKGLAGGARASQREVNTKNKVVGAFRKLVNKGLYGVTGAPLYASTNIKRMAKDLKEFNPGRAVVTHPGTTSFAHRMGIRPELAVTDYGVNNKGSKSFWNLARGVVKGPKNPLSSVHHPSAEGREVFKDLKIPKNPVSSIPIEARHLKPKEKIDTNISREFERFSHNKKSAGKITVPAGKKLVVIQGGGTGQNVDQMARTVLKKNRGDVFYVAVGGKNKKVLAQLQELEKANPGSFASTGFAMNLDKLNRQAHVAISRPHGLSTTEIGAAGTPNINVVRERHVNIKPSKLNQGKGGRKGASRILRKVTEFKDSYAGHMVGNAKHYREKAGSPIANLTTVVGKTSRESDSLNKHLDNVLKYHGNFSNRASKWSDEIRQTGGGAKQIVDKANTSYSKFKGISRKARGVSYVAAAGLAAGGVHQMGKYFKAKKDVKL